MSPRPRKILLVSFHFYPSPEVGAKRPTATALFLQDLGYDVTVLRARQRGSGGEIPKSSRGPLETITVAVPRNLFWTAWIRLKLLLRRVRGAAAADAATAAGRPGDAGHASATSERRVSLLGWCRRQVLAFDTLFQGHKRWLLVSTCKLWWYSRRQRFDLVIASGPPMVSYICGWIASFMGGPKLILDYRDPWYLHGDKELTTVMLGHPLANFENRLADRCARRCAALVAASPGTKRHIVERFDVPADAVRVIRNGFDAHALVEEPVPFGRLDILYTGSLYWNRNPFPFLEAMSRLVDSGSVDRSKLRLRLVGRCERWKDVPLAPWIDDHGMRDIVEIVEFVPPDRLRSLVAESNVLINFAQGQPRQIPAKSYDYIAAGREVVVIAESDSDVADLFREAGIGHIVEPGNSEQIEQVLRLLYARYVAGNEDGARVSADVMRYSRARRLEEFGALVEEVLNEPGAGTPR